MSIPVGRVLLMLAAIVAGGFIAIGTGRLSLGLGVGFICFITWSVMVDVMVDE